MAATTSTTGNFGVFVPSLGDVLELYVTNGIVTRAMTTDSDPRPVPIPSGEMLECRSTGIMGRRLYIQPNGVMHSNGQYGDECCIEFESEGGHYTGMTIVPSSGGVPIGQTDTLSFDYVSGIS